ncbi:MAG: hypothetical protein WCD49_04305 [Candidatus Acidiferrales bacterium]
MTDATLVLSAIQPDVHLNALDSLAEISALAAAVKRRANVISLAWDLRKADKTIRDLLERVYGILEGKIHVQPATEPVTPQQIEGMIDNLDMIARMIDTTHESMRRVGLTNNSLTAGSLASLVKHREGILDMADWFDASLKTDVAAAIFARAKRERVRPGYRLK